MGELFDNRANEKAQEIAIYRELQKIFPSHQIQMDFDSKSYYGKDWTSYFEVSSSGVIFPTEMDQVQKLVQLARKMKMKLIPSGGRTGLSGAAVATQGEWVVSFDRMNKILNWNPTDRVLTVEPGCTTEQVQNFAKEQGCHYPIDFASRGSSQIGGNIATNAGGIKVLRYGLTRDWVVGLKVVTGKGDLLDLNRGLVKNATGYDLRHLIIGSEGTLGLIVEAQLKLAEAPPSLQVLILGSPDLGSIMKIYQSFKSKMVLTAFEMFSDRSLAKVLQAKGKTKPLSLDCPFYVVMEVEMTSTSFVDDTLMSLFEHALEQCWVLDGSISQSPQQSRDFWSLREDISESITPYGPYKNDISVKVSQVPDFVKELERVLLAHYPDWEILWFGHIGDGNLHINILPPNNIVKETFLTECRKVDPLVFEVVQKYGGSISAEHGVGLTKKPFLHFSRSVEEIEILKQIKSVFDPDGILNPGKIF